MSPGVRQGCTRCWLVLNEKVRREAGFLRHFVCTRLHAFWGYPGLNFVYPAAYRFAPVKSENHKLQSIVGTLIGSPLPMIV